MRDDEPDRLYATVEQKEAAIAAEVTAAHATGRPVLIGTLDVAESERLATRLAASDEYAEVFDPYKDTACIRFRISDDIAAVAADLIHGLKHYQAGRPLEALWWWQYSYLTHWGTHGGAALRALHALIAHASLDVTEERTAR